MELDAQDIITALSNQRNSALNELAQAFAIIEAQKRELAELKKDVPLPATDISQDAAQ